MRGAMIDNGRSFVEVFDEPIGKWRVITEEEWEAGPSPSKQYRVKENNE